MQERRLKTAKEQNCLIRLAVEIGEDGHGEQGSQFLWPIYS